MFHLQFINMKRKKKDNCKTPLKATLWSECVDKMASWMKGQRERERGENCFYQIIVRKITSSIYFVVRLRAIKKERQISFRPSGMKWLFSRNGHHWGLQISVQSGAGGQCWGGKDLSGQEVHTGDVSSGSGSNHWGRFYDQDGRGRRGKSQGKD